MIEIQKNAAPPTRIKREHKTSKKEVAVIERFEELYARLYGIKPKITREGVYYRVNNTAGMTIGRMKEVIAHMKFRLDG